MYIKNDSEYDNSRFINYNRWSNAKEVDALVTALLVNIKSRKKAGYKSVLKVLLLDLYQSYVADPEQYIGYVRDSTYYHFKVKVGENRYVINPHITYFCLIGAIDMLVEFGYVSSKTGQHFANEELGDNGFLSKMRATAKLASLYEEHGLTTDMIHKFRQEEVIVQKDIPVEETVKDRKTGKDKKVKKKYEFDYTDTPETERMRGVVQRYNKQLDDTHIDCDAECISDADRKGIIGMLKEYKTNDPVVSVDMSSKNVHRVFNNRSWEQGGRFYGAWWIGCPSVLRKYITIDGEPTVELDYSGIHIHLLYAMKGINYAKRKEDAYALGDGVPDRDLNKLILLTALNAETVEGARDSVYDQLRKENRLKLYNFKRSKTPIMEKITLLKLKHAEIADCIASGEGVKLQYLDSCVIEKLIMYGVESDIPVLTVHDSVICQAKYSDLIKDKMWQCYSDMLNTQLKCNIKYTKFTPHAGSVIKLLPVHNNQHIPPYSYIANDPLHQRYRPSPEMITNILKQDDIIKISNDSRTNTCAGTCRHGIRVSNYKTSKNNYLGTVKVKLKYSLGITG